MKIAILDDYQDVVRQLDCFSLLKDFDVTVYTDGAESLDALVARLQDKQALVLIRERTEISAALLERLPRLKIISQTGKISSHVRLQDCSDHGIAFAEGTGSPIAPSELCWSLILASSRHLLPYAANFQAGRWQDSGELGLGRTLDGLTLGIWGYGKIGKRIAGYGQAFGMQVLVWGSEASRASAVADGHEAAPDKQAFFERCDVLSLHLRLGDSSQGCVDFDDLQRMKTDALIVNTSRAPLIEAGALYRALQSGRPGYAAIDVYDSEPANAQREPLLGLANVLALPHLGYVEKNSYELYFKTAFENLVNFARGRPQNIANPEVL